MTVDGDLLDWRASLEVINHSPTGIEWGYGGRGPAQLGLAILLTMSDEKTAVHLHQRFKEEFLVDLKEERAGSTMEAVPTRKR